MFRQLRSFLNRLGFKEKTLENPLSSASVKTCYLVDLENVGPQGLAKIGKINPQSERVFIFSTEYAPSVPTAIIEQLFEILKRAPNSIEFFQVPARSQSVDMHLVSFLGRLIGVRGATCQYVVISNDTDFDNIVNFWKTRENIDVKRQGRLTPSKKTPETTVPKRVESPPTSPAPTSVLPSNVNLNNLIQKAVANAGFPNQTVGKVASIVCKNRDENDFLEKALEAVQNEYPNSPKLINALRDALQKALTATPESVKYSFKAPRSPRKTRLLEEVVAQILTEEKFTPESIEEVSKFASECYGKDNAKRTLHGLLVAQYGQEEGLRRYNLLKELF